MRFIDRGELNSGRVAKDERSISHGEKARSNTHGDAHAQRVVFMYVCDTFIYECKRVCLVF